MLSMETARVRYQGDGATTAFAIPWYFLSADDVKVIRRDNVGNEQVLTGGGVDYTITGAGDEAGGTCTMTVAPIASCYLVIRRNEPATQATDYVANDPFPASSHELALDKLTMLMTQSKDLWTRSLRLHETDGLAAGAYDAGTNRITQLADPVDDTDAATKGWVSILLAQYAQGIATVVTPGGSGLPQWNASRIQNASVAATPPADNDVLTFSVTNNRWEPKASMDGLALLGRNNTWTNFNTFNVGLTCYSNITLQGVATAFNFSADQQRIQGKFYGVPYSSRTLFRPNIAPSDCYLGIAPYTAGTAGLAFYGSGDPDNAPVLMVAASASSHIIDTGKTGAGVTQDLVLSANGSAAIRVRTNGRVGVGTATDNGALVNVNGAVSRLAGTFRAHRNGVVQNIPDSTFTKVQLTTEDYDQAGWYDAPNAKYVPLIPGKYAINFGVGMDGAVVGAGQLLASVLYKNGVVHRLGNHSASPAGGNNLEAVGMATVDANGSTDYFEMYCIQVSGVAKDINGRATDCFIEGFHIG